ncbi:hypothetical protein AWA1501_17170 [Lactiplantibacillus pentosus]|jgi:hypothetical protein|nr:hypothetical protein AWA1501_17170 [Lactiplantibacillus pentosus]
MKLVQDGILASAVEWEYGMQHAQVSRVIVPCWHYFTKQSELIISGRYPMSHFNNRCKGI